MKWTWLQYVTMGGFTIFGSAALFLVLSAMVADYDDDRD